MGKVVKGSCVCGKSTYEFTGEYSAFIACHCIPCRKVSGADRSLNLVVSKDDLKVTSGGEKRLSRKADSGKDLWYTQCENCGSTLFAVSDAKPDILFLKVGLIDDKDFLDSLGTPKQELYCKYLWSWEKAFAGAEVVDSQ